MFDRFSQLDAGDRQIVVGLQVQPYLGGRAEIAPQAQSGIGGDATASGNDVRDAGRRYINCCRQRACRHIQRGQEFFRQNFTRVDRRERVGDILVRDSVLHDLFLLQVWACSASLKGSKSSLTQGWLGREALSAAPKFCPPLPRSSVVVGDLYIVGIAAFPSETDSILVIDPDAELPIPVAFQGLQSVARRGSQVVQLDRGLEIIQFALNLSFNVPPSLYTSALGELFRVFVRK